MQGPPSIESALLHEPDPDAEGSLVIRIGSIVGGGVLVALASGFPAALRVTGDAAAVRGIELWLVLTGIATPLGVLAVAVVRRARVGIRLLLADRGWVLAMGILWWGVIELGLLAVFAALLRKTTHHHGLAGVTFSAFAVGSGIVTALFAFNATRAAATHASRIGLFVAAGAAFLALAIVGVRTSRADDMHTASLLLDAFAFAGATVLASSRSFIRFRGAALGGLPVAVLAIVVGLTLLRLVPEIQTTLLQTAPMHALVLEVFR